MTDSEDGAIKVGKQSVVPKPTEVVSTGKYSLYINLGWTFSNDPKNQPSGKYTLIVNEEVIRDGKNNQFSNGQILLDQKLKKLKGQGELTITLTNGPTYHAKIKLGGLPNIATPDGLARRLTNLGFYAGPDTDGKCTARMAWAIRAFKRVKMNNYVRNSKEVEDNRVTVKFLEAVQKAYGKHPNDAFTGEQKFAASAKPVAYCRMFGDHVYRRGSFETRGQPDDVDQGPGQTGVWEGKKATPEAGKPKPEPEPIAGDYVLYLRPFDPDATMVDPKTKQKIKIGPFSNRVNLPQPIHMAQFVLFELGYWLVGGETKDTDWVAVGTNRTRNKFIPNGKFDRYTQWAVREFQCHAKFPNAAKEDVSSKDLRYMLRVFKATQNNPPKLSGDARYPDAGKVSGALNEVTRKALQAWADGALRCPVIIYSSTDNKNKISGNGSNLDRILRENLWLYNDHPSTAPRMYVIDYSGYYTIPNAYRGEVSNGGYTFSKPIIIGDYATYPNRGKVDVGPRSKPPDHSWASADVEVTPANMLGRGETNGDGLTESELSIFKVVRTASHYECYGYFDTINAYDDVTISFGPCHWTLADCSSFNAAAARELPAFLAYVRHQYADTYLKFFGIFGLTPKETWPIKMDGSCAYNSSINFQTEKENIILCGVLDRDKEGLEENKYGKNWHFFYRFQMATRTSTDLRCAMWDFTKFRIRDILNKSLEVSGKSRRIGDYVTSEKGVAMLLRWHIYRPGHITRERKFSRKGKLLQENHLLKIFEIVIPEHSSAAQDREDAMLEQLSVIGGPLTRNHLTEIFKIDTVIQQGTVVPVLEKGKEVNVKYNYYHLNLTNSTLSKDLNSFNSKEL